MGFFSSPEDNYSNERQVITDEVLKQIVSRAQSTTLTQDEEVVIESALRARKHEFAGKLSLRDVYLVLHKLRLSHSISEYDEHEVMKDLKVIFENK
ncbi:MAG: hypothetical protein KAZ30_04245 [Candidatus Magasanikbacteria bacterium]|nr:hypothetical protein [Candidatus Magasanikbacteria bacterium]